jgi:hypothetical protein
MLGFLRWVLAVAMTVFLAASQIGPGEAVSNLAKWADLLGFHPIPLILKTKAIDQWVALGSGLVLFSILLSWIVEYQILQGYVKQHGGASAFAAIEPRQHRVISASLIAGLLILVVVGLAGYFEISQPYQLSEQNAYLRVVGIAPIFPTAPDNQFKINFILQNVGKQTSTSTFHTNNTFKVAPAELSDKQINSDFATIADSLKKQLDTQSTGSMEANETGYYTYVMANGSDVISQVESGKVRLYIYWVEIYRDGLIPPETFIATEECMFILPTHAIAKCGSHNGQHLIK